MHRKLPSEFLSRDDNRRRRIESMKKPDDDSNAAGFSPRMMRARPDPTEFQMFGGVIGVLVVGLTVIGILYALVQSLR